MKIKSLRKKAELYDKMIASRSKGGKITASKMTPEQRIERARKAQKASVIARMRNKEEVKHTF